MRYLKKNLAILFALTILTSSCASIKISDREVCTDAGSAGAFCFNTLTTKERDLAKPQWDRLRIGQLCMDSKAFAEWKTAIQTLCQETGRCDYETEKKVNSFLQNVYSTKSRAIKSSKK